MGCEPIRTMIRKNTVKFMHAKHSDCAMVIRILIFFFFFLFACSNLEYPQKIIQKGDFIEPLANLIIICHICHSVKKAPSSIHNFAWRDIYSAADVFSFGKGVNRRYGLTMRNSGKRVLASSFLTPGWTITSSPGTQLIGVVMRCLSPV